VRNRDVLTGLTAAFVCATFAGAAAFVQTGAKTSIVFILDASGSMAAKYGTTTKMDAAKRVMTELVKDLSPDVRAGLMAYGHRQKSVCTDVELLVPVQVVDKDVFTRKIAALHPLGQTPISESIRQAAGVLKGVAGKKVVILVSDGEETCKQDPCALAADLKKADIDLTVHVVGFGLDTAAAKRQLQCVATATGGTYADATDAADLKRKISEAAGGVTKGATGKLVTVVQDMNGTQLKYEVSFYRPVGKIGDQPINSTSLGNQAFDSVHELDIPPGTYDVLYATVALPFLWKRNVEIKAGQETRAEFARFGRIRLAVNDPNGQRMYNAYVEVKDGTPQQNDLITDHRYRETIDLPAGTYDVKVWSTGLPEAWQKGVVVKSGQETALTVTMRR